jgi:hypothetical protein
LIVGYTEEIFSVLFAHIGAKRTKNAVWGISPLRRRRGLRALDLRKLLEKFDQNFRKGTRPYDETFSSFPTGCDAFFMPCVL